MMRKYNTMVRACGQVMDSDAGCGRVLCAVAGTIARPGATFRTISGSPGSYAVSSMAVFLAVCLASALPYAGMWPGSDDGAPDGFGSSVRSYAASLIWIVPQNFLFIYAVFWIGRRYGQNLKFKSAFPVLPYCLIPIAILAVAALTGAHLLDPPGLARDDGPDMDADLSPSYAVDFAGASAALLAHNAFAGFFLAWAFVLFVKAVKILHGFGTGRAVVVLVLAAAAAYAFSMALGVLRGLLSVGWS